MVWVVSELYYPESTSTGHFLTGIAEGLAQKHRVSVLCSQPTYSSRGVRCPTTEERNGVTVHRCRGTTFDKNVLLLRTINGMSFVCSILAQASMRLKKDDIALVVTNPPLVPLAVVLACRLRGAKCMLLVHDVYPDVLVAAGMARPQSMVVRLLDHVVRTVLRRVRCVVVLAQDMAEKIVQKDTSVGPKVRVIPNWADLDVVKPDPTSGEAIRKLHGWRERLILQYCGNIGRTHDFDTLLDAAARLRDNEQVRFVIMGWGAAKKQVVERVASAGLKNVTILSSCEYNRLSSYLNSCDIAVVTLRKGMSGLSVPSRMYNVMAAGKPLLGIAENDSEVARAIREHGIGWRVEPGDHRGLVAVIEQALRDPGSLAEIGGRARQAAQRCYSYETVISAFSGAVTDVMSGQ